MTPDELLQVEELYQAAAETTSSRREVLLAGVKSEVRAEVELRLSQRTTSISAPTAAKGLPIGTMLGPYRLDATLGVGGMGVVYQGTDTKLTRPVAVKFLSDNLADATARRRFQQEAQMASSLNHPHIVTIYDAGEIEGKQYIVAEFIDGGTLSDWAKQERRTWRQVVDLLIGVADGLAAAHAAKIMHRDVKPANILVTGSGYAKLTDFGLAKLAGEADSDLARTLSEMQTQPGMVVGTIPYMSPEQASGQTIDRRSDIFSFGAVLYEMLAGRRPFAGKTNLETLQKVIHENPQPLKDGIPPQVQAVVEKAMEKDPAERYQSMVEMVVDLKRMSKLKLQETVSTAPTSLEARGPALWRWIVAAVAASLLGIAVWKLRPIDNSLDNPLANAQFTRFTDFPGSETDPAISRDGKFVAFRSDRDGPVDTFVSQVGSGQFLNLTKGTQSTVLLRNMGFTPDGSEIWLSGVINGTRLRLIGLTGGSTRSFLTEHAMNPAWSPDGSRIVFHTYDEGDPFFVSDNTGANERQIYKVEGGRHSHFPTWSPDGQWIYFVSGLWDTKEMDLWRIRPSGENPERLTHHSSDVRSVAPLDNRTIVYAAPDQNGAGPWLWALDTERKVTRRITTGLEVYSSVEASADGSRLVASVSNPTASLWSIPLGGRVAEAGDVKRLSLPSVRALAPRYGGTSLFYLSSKGGGDGLWRYENGQAIEIWKGSEGALFEAPAVSADGKRVAIILRKQGKRTLHTLSADGGELRRVGESIDAASTAGWSPDGKWIVAGGTEKGAPGLFKIPIEGGEPVRLAKGIAMNPVWSPDGSLIVYTGAAVGVSGPLMMIRPDGTPIEGPSIQLRVGGARYRFVPGRLELIYVPGSQLSPEDFWLLDLATRKTRRLSNFENHSTKTFDVTPDGKQLVFDRLNETSDIVLIDLPRKGN